MWFLDSVSDSWSVPMMKMTDLSILCMWENLKNQQCKYLFAPLYIYIKIYIFFYISSVIFWLVLFLKSYLFLNVTFDLGNCYLFINSQTPV